MREPSAASALRQFSLTDPPGDDRYDVPALLRRVADTLEELGPVEVADVVFDLPPSEDGDERPTITVRYHPTTSFEDVRDAFAPFLRDAEATAGVRFVVEDGGADDGSLRVVVRAADGTWDGFTFDRQGRGDDTVLRALECFDVLQETVHDVLARGGRFGPWPPCPVDGHTHRLTTAWEPQTSTGWWACPAGERTTRIGELSQA